MGRGRAPARLALTFDYYPEVVTARDIMTAKGINTATYYAWYPNIVTGIPIGDQVSASDLRLMKRLGWEIGGYTNENMITRIKKSRNDAYGFLRDLADGMDGKGFRADTIAPNQRAWNTSLADLARDWFKGVRVADVITAFQQYPIEDPLYVRGGAANSWGYGTNDGSDSPAVILARIDNLIADGGLGIEVVHKVGSVGDPMTFTTADFAAVMSGIASRVSTGRLQLVTMTQALTPP
jgi:hypothetical protein